MRADNDGEGGILALITLIRRRGVRGGRRTKLVLAGLGVFGASLFFGDSMITPAISVLSAVEGVNVAAPSLSDLVVPITAAIILVLFMVQRFGTAVVGRFFGPVMAVWFTAIGACGIHGITAHPEILKALSPTYAAEFLFGHFSVAFFSLAAVVLAVTGAEALYADMGHFGRAPITRIWLLLVFPGLHPQLPGTGRAHPRQPERHDRQPLLPARAELVATADGVPRGRGDGHRLAGRDQWCVLRHPTGSPARLPTAAAHRTHLGTADRPDLRAVDQLGATRGGPHPGVRVQDRDRARLRLRRGRHRHDHDHDAALLLPRPLPVAKAALARGHGRRRHSLPRPALPRGEPDEDHARRVAAARDRVRDLHRAHHLAARPRARQPPP